MDGRRTRFEQLTLPLERDLHYAALSLTGQQADALDLVQEAYLRAYRAFDTYRVDENIRGWMFTILRNAYLDSCRRRKTQPVFADLSAEPVEATPSAPFAPSEELLPDELQRALDSLSPTHRLLAQLADIEGLSYREIAEIVGCPLGTVMSGLHNARHRLRAALERQRSTS